MKQNKDLKSLEEKLEVLKTAKYAAFIVSCLLIMGLTAIPLALLKWILIGLTIAGAVAGQVIIIKKITKIEESIKILRKFKDVTIFQQYEKEQKVENVITIQRTKSKNTDKNNSNETDLTV